MNLLSFSTALLALLVVADSVVIKTRTPGEWEDDVQAHESGDPFLDEAPSKDETGDPFLDEAPPKDEKLPVEITTWYITPRDQLPPTNDRDRLRYYLNPVSRQILAEAAALSVMGLNLYSESSIERIFLPNKIESPESGQLEPWYIQIYWEQGKLDDSRSHWTAETSESAWTAEDVRSEDPPNNQKAEPKAEGKRVNDTPVTNLSQWIHEAIMRGDSMGEVRGSIEDWDWAPAVQFRIRSLNSAGEIGPDSPPSQPTEPPDWELKHEAASRVPDAGGVKEQPFEHSVSSLNDHNGHDLDSDSARILGDAAADLVMRLAFSESSFTRRIFAPDKADPRSTSFERWYIQIEWANPYKLKENLNRFVSDSSRRDSAFWISPQITLGQWIHKAVLRGEKSGSAESRSTSSKIMFRVGSFRYERSSPFALPAASTDDKADDDPMKDKEKRDIQARMGDSPSSTEVLVSSEETPSRLPDPQASLHASVRPPAHTLGPNSGDWHIVPSDDPEPEKKHRLNPISLEIMARAAARYVMQFDMSKSSDRPITERIYVPNIQDHARKTLEPWYIKIDYTNPNVPNALPPSNRIVDYWEPSAENFASMAEDYWDAPLITLGQWIYKAVMKRQLVGEVMAFYVCTLKFQIHSMPP
ncbi:MAG: hypothetical protein M1837_007421 [Sclerophora amabilis]|nr:MAG: hypothetical protein M1837_007421 [Sclerophora amabilis]